MMAMTFNVSMSNGDERPLFHATIRHTATEEGGGGRGVVVCGMTMTMGAGDGGNM